MTLTKNSKEEPTYLLSGNKELSDEYYINEIIGIDEFRYEDWLGIERRKITNDGRK